MIARARLLLLPFAMALVGGPTLACSAPCASTIHYYTGGTPTPATATSPARYESSPDTGPFLPFQGGAIMHFRHEMGVRVQSVEVYLAFTQYPLGEGGGGYSLAAGNQAIIQGNDEHDFVIRNDSCSAYYVRVVLTGAPQPTGDAATGG